MKTKEQLEQEITDQWQAKGHKVDWLKVEQQLADVLNTDTQDAAWKIKWAKECLDAHTRRGHFQHENT